MNFWKKREDDSVLETALTNGQWKTKNSSNNGVGDSEKNSALVSQARQDSDVDADDIERRFGKVRSALGEGTVIHGKLSFDVPVRLDGKLSGEVYSSKPLIVGTSGKVDADIETTTLIVCGQVKGRVQAKERIEILKGGSLDGDVSAPVFVVEEGAHFNGSISMNREAVSSLNEIYSAAEKVKREAEKTVKDQKPTSQKPEDSKKDEKPVQVSSATI